MKEVETVERSDSVVTEIGLEGSPESRPETKVRTGEEADR